MFASRNLQKHCFKTLSSLILNNPFKNALLPSDVPLKLMSSNAIQTSFPIKDVSLCSTKIFNCFEGSRAMSTGKGRSMRSKVESRMRKESGKTLREIRRAKKLRKKLMTDEERLVYNLRRALFKARFEQALESQKLNIKKLEQQLRRMGVNPDDPVAMASIRRVASTFFNAIDKKDGSPYVFREDKQSEVEPSRNLRWLEPGEDSDQEELDRFIAEIEDAADKEWAEEEAAEKEELGKIRYWSRDDLGGRFRRSELLRSEDSVDATRGGGRSWKDAESGRRRSDDEGDEEWDSNGVGDASDYESDTADHDQARYKFKAPRVERGKQNGVGRANGNKGFKRNVEAKFSENLPKDDSGSDNMLSDVEDAMWQSDSEGKQDLGKSEATRNDYRSSSDEEEDFLQMKRDEKNGVAVVNHFESDSEDFDESLDKMNLSRVATEKHSKIHIANNNKAFDRNAGANFGGKIAKEKYESEDLSGDSDIAMWESDAEEDVDSETLRSETYDHRNNSEDDDYVLKKDGKGGVNDKKKKTPKQADETWDSD
ncbi:uncharacterized protein LOC114312677 isoform X2 [Camellia sinensis]|uniref:uncharacterized protein LOC114312677 isoform X2 n=1 Tax=Camellia sinensis TaxID=4442 RepID=UPI00103631DF|nr:uncharacterized protein LOC114312677 isoform X2 [Camellia sinensis]